MNCVVSRFHLCAIGVRRMERTRAKIERRISPRAFYNCLSNLVLNRSTPTHIRHTKPDQKSEFLRRFWSFLLIEQINALELLDRVAEFLHDELCKFLRSLAAKVNIANVPMENLARQSE